jgi:hypothetical protein
VSRLLGLGALLALLLGTPAHSQVRIEGPGRDPAVRLARDILAGGNYLLLDRDTILGPDFHAPADLVVLGADVRIEGSVAGRVAVIDGDFFIRPRARVPGPIAVVGGGAYPSGLAEVGPIVEAPGRPPLIERDEQGVRVVLREPDTGPATHPLGIFGLGLPTYDRVDGLTVRAGRRWRPLRTERGPTLDGRISFRTARRSFGGELRAELPLVPEVRLVARAARETRTNEHWIRGDLSNTLAALFAGSDARDYWSADVLSVGVASVRPPAVQGEVVVRPRLTLVRSRDASLEARAPWSLFGRLDRPNQEIDEGILTSAVAGAELTWRAAAAGGRLDAQVERGLGAGAFGFTQVVADGDTDVEALWGHRVEVRGHTRWAFDPAPPQRWSFVGGTGTLPTLPTADLRGDRLVFLGTRYLAPLPVRVPLAGAPDLVLAHAVGAAWHSEGERPPLEQNLGAGVRLMVLEALLWIDPAAERRTPRLQVELRLPF